MTKLRATVLLFWLSCLPALAQESLTLPEPSAQDLFERSVLPPPVFPAAAVVPVARICAGIAALPTFAEPLFSNTADSGCSFETDKFFVSVRGASEIVTTARIKLNSQVGSEPADLAEMSALAAALFKQLSWQFPQSMADAIEQGERQRCQTGALRFDFSRERGEVPRYNLILAFDGTLPEAYDFVRWLMPCHA